LQKRQPTGCLFYLIGKPKHHLAIEGIFYTFVTNVFIMTLQVKIINQSNYPLPAYETLHAAGMDLRANCEESISIAPMERRLIGTGIKIALPLGFEAQIRPRSGLAYKNGITVLNSPGTIDADYRGEIKILLINLSQEIFHIQPGDRIAQMIVAAHEKVTWELSDALEDSDRGSGGYGSTGK